MTKEQIVEDFSALLDEYWLPALSTKERIVLAKVVGIEKDWVVVDANLKSQFSIPKPEFLDAKGELPFSIGDFVKVFVEGVDDGFGETRLSREKAKHQETWDNLQTALETQQNMRGVVLYKIKGGYHVDVYGLRAFLPGSLADIRPAREVDDLEGKEIEFKVMKLDKEKNNILISRKAVFAKELAEQREKLLETIKEGSVLKGRVKNMVNYGAFVGLDGIDGLLHVTDMSWRRVKRPEEIVSIGQELEVKVLKFNHEQQRVSLGMKQLTEDPWLALKDKVKVGDKTKAKVTNIIQYGCFAEITDGVEGLVHLSEMSWSSKNVRPSKLVEVGQEVEVMVLDLDAEQRRLSLGMKQCKSNPWVQFAEKHKPGDKMTGVINTITDFGLFVDLGDDVHTDGLVHASDIDWKESGKNALQKYKKGDTVEVVVIAIDVNKERVSLGIKQLADDPFAVFCKNHPIGSDITACVKSINNSRMQLESEGISVQVRLSNDNADRIKGLKDGDEVSLKVVSFDNKYRQVKADFEAPEVSSVEILQPEKVDTIGALIKAATDNATKVEPSEESSAKSSEKSKESDD